MVDSGIMGLRENRNDKTGEVPSHRLVANFMSGSAPLEEYLRQGKPLTDSEMELISLTLAGLQTFITVWKRKNPTPPQ